MAIGITPVRGVERWPKFRARLLEACEKHAACPPLHKGRQTWLRDRLAERGVQVEVESIRKWLAGEMRPRDDKCLALAAVLGVDDVWLLTGAADRQAGPDEAAAPGDSLIGPVLSIMVREGVVVQLSGLPINLELKEAQRIANIVLAHAVVE